MQSPPQLSQEHKRQADLLASKAGLSTSYCLRRLFDVLVNLHISRTFNMGSFAGVGRPSVGAWLQELLLRFCVFLLCFIRFHK